MSTWNPKLKLQYVRPVIRNMVDAIRANQVAALAWAAAPALLPPADFAWIGRAIHVEPRYPYVVVLASKSTAAEDAETAGADVEHQIIVQIGCTGNDPDALADELFIRVNAVDSILTEMTPAEWLEPMHPDDERLAGIFVLVSSSHDYGAFARSNANQLYEHRCQMTITVRYREQ